MTAATPSRLTRLEQDASARLDPSVLSRFDRKITTLKDEIARLEPVLSQPTQTPGSFVTGRSNRPKSLDRCLDAENNRRSKTYRQLVKARKDLTYFESLRRGYASGERHANGQPVADSPSRQAQRKREDMIAQGFRERLKKGDRVALRMNPSSQVVVKRVNSMTITSESGERWRYDEIVPAVRLDETASNPIAPAPVPALKAPCPTPVLTTENAPRTLEWKGTMNQTLLEKADGLSDLQCTALLNRYVPDTVGKQVKLLGWYSDNVALTARLLLYMALLGAIPHPERQSSEGVGVEYQGTRYCVSDNGGELNIYDGEDNYLRSIPTTTNMGGLTVATIAYRLLAVLQDRSIDYNLICSGKRIFPVN